MASPAFCISTASLGTSAINRSSCVTSISRRNVHNHRNLKSSSSSFIQNRSSLHHALRSFPAQNQQSTYKKKDVIRCNMPGNIEDLPLERIPSDPDAVPAYWHRPGVYGVYDKDNALQFVAATKDVGSAISTHIKKVPNPADNVYAVRMLTVDSAEDELPLNAFAERWIMALYEAEVDIPPGNTDAASEWRIDPTPTDVYFSNSIVTGDIESRVEEEIKDILRNYKIVLFMKGTKDSPKCGFSKSVVDILSRQHYLNEGDFVCVDCLDANKNQGLRDGIKQFSNWPTIPQLYVDGDFVGGADIVQEMEMKGELPAIFAS